MRLLSSYGSLVEWLLVFVVVENSAYKAALLHPAPDGEGSGYS